jgi:hypothetical protein
VHSRRVVGWSIGASQTAALPTNALSMAIANRSPRPQTGTVIHSDHSVQFTWWPEGDDDPHWGRLCRGEVGGGDVAG